VTEDSLLALGVMITVGLIGGLLSNKLKFPRITGYIVVGVILSPSLLGLLTQTTLDKLEIITTFSLAIIGYAIGGSLRLESIRKLGKGIAWITIGETVGALLLVTLLVALLGPRFFEIPGGTLLHTYLPIALVIGAAVCPAAPAVTLAVIRELKARGPLTTNLLAVVALDDALGVIIFAIVLGVTQPLVTGGGTSLYMMLGIPFLEILKSVGIGTALGFAVIQISRLVKTRALLLALIVGILILSVGLAAPLGTSVILTSMVVGFVVRNKIGRFVGEDEPFTAVEGIEDVIFAVFFVLAGMHFDLSVIKVAGMLALLIFGGRFLGKYLGVRLSARAVHAPEVVKKYLSFALMPEAGVTIGLALLAKDAFPSLGNALMNGILASVIINELVAPPLTRYAITKAGEAEETPKPAPEAH